MLDVKLDGRLKAVAAAPCVAEAAEGPLRVAALSLFINVRPARPLTCRALPLRWPGYNNFIAPLMRTTPALWARQRILNDAWQ